MLSKSDATGFWRYVWNSENRLVAVYKNNKTVRYQYDALGRRVSRHGKGVGTTAKYTYDGQDVILDESSEGTVKYQNGLGIDNKLKITSNGISKYFLQDHLGSTIGLTDSNGNVVSSAGYDSFGNSTNSLGTRYQYTGREFDEFTGLYYYRARWYDANLGRFISEDPVGFAGGDINLFGYVKNNPANFSDPLGLFPEGLPSHEIQRRKEQCEAIRELLRREQAEGTGAASWLSSVTFGGDTSLQALNNRTNGNIPINGKEFDLDWYMDANAVTGEFSPILGPAAYAGGKLIWSGSNYIRGHEQTYPLPYQDPGEFEAVMALSRRNKYSDLFNQTWFEDYCPCEK
jgi:RHS repeat-associated protein